MYERSYGSKYQESRGFSEAQVAAAIRADIKAAVKAGNLPGAPVKYSVRKRSYAGGFSIDIEAQDWPEAYVPCEGEAPSRFSEFGPYVCQHYMCAGRARAEGQPVSGDHREYKNLSPEGASVIKKLEAISWAYNYDGSESQVDYFDRRFYGSIDIEDDWHREFRQKEAAAKKFRANLRKAQADSGISILSGAEK